MDLQRQAEEFRYAYDVDNSEANSDMQFDLIYEEFHEFKEAHTNMMAYVEERE